MTKNRISSLLQKLLSRSRWLILVPALVGFLFTSSSAEADALGVWEFSKSCLANEGGQVVPVEGGFVLVGADGGTCAGMSHYVRMQAIVPEGTNQIGFLWTYQTNDGAWYDPPQIILNGVITQLTNQSNATGSGLIQVEAGDIFAFQQYSTDSCCQPGNLTITGLTLGLGEWVSTTSSTTTTTTSTSIAPSTTVLVTSPTTTTAQETTTTTSSLPQTSVPSTTMEPPQTTTTLQETVSTVTSTSSTTTSTSTTVAPTTTTTVYVPPATTSTVPETTTTTTTEPEPVPTTTLPPPLETTTSTSTTPPTTTSTVPPVTTTQPDVTTTLQTPSDEPEPLTQTELLNTIEALSEASTEAIEAIVDTVLTKDLDTSQATLLITTPAVLENITTDQAEQLFNEIAPTELSPDEAEAVVEAVQEAPSSVRKAFESVLNIFQGFADTYVPLNSTVPVKTRRALIALGAVFLTVAPAPARRIR
jgi:hypothetical protein